MAGEEVGRLPIVEPVEALRYFRAKGFTIGFSWQDVWQETHAHAFTVAKAMSRDLLEDIRAAVDAAIAEGQTLEQFRSELEPLLRKKGWWGRKSMLDPLTGQYETVQLGSPRRLKTIFQVNMRTAYQAGRWERMQRQKKMFPFLRYVSVMDGRERPEHHAWHGTVLPIDDAWWDSHYPPCGWNCRCTAAPLNQRMIDRRGWSVSERPEPNPPEDFVNRRTGEVTEVEQGIDAGWSYNVGRAALDGAMARAIGGMKSFWRGVLRGFSGGDEGALNAVGRPGFPNSLSIFFAGFGLPDAAAIERGHVWLDPAGWPLAIGASMFRDEDGAIAVPPDAARRLPSIGAALRDPDTISLRWVAGADGLPLLMRRYARAGSGVVDIGRAGWRAVAGDVTAPLGLVIWTREEGAIAAYDPSQARDAKGRWSRGGALGGLLDGPPTAHKVGEIDEGFGGKLAAIGLTPGTRSVHVETGRARHILRTHSAASEVPRGQRAIDAVDLASAGSILNAAHHVERGQPVMGKQGNPRFVAKSAFRGANYTTVGETRRKGVTIISMWKR